MTTELSQRWNNKKSSFVPPNAVCDVSQFEISEIGEQMARDFILRTHYSKSYPSARRRFGLFLHGELVGVAVFSHPMSDKVLTNVFPGKATDSMELGRLVLHDSVQFNGESWFVAQCFKRLKSDIRGVVSFSDPQPRTTATGEVFFAGHLGTIYKALNGVFLGRGHKASLRLLPNGTVFSPRAISKIRAKDQGWMYSARILEEVGAAPLSETEDATAWLDRWLPQLTRPMRHQGNLKYAWTLWTKGEKAFSLPTSLPYPTRKDSVQQPAPRLPFALS